MNGKELGQALRSGARVYGTAVVSTVPWWPRMISETGLDFVFLDTEHVPIDRETLASMCQAYTVRGLPPIVRIPVPDATAAAKMFDIGACGVIAPYVETREQAIELVMNDGDSTNRRGAARIASPCSLALTAWMHSQNLERQDPAARLP